MTEKFGADIHELGYNGRNCFHSAVHGRKIDNMRFLHSIDPTLCKEKDKDGVFQQVTKETGSTTKHIKEAKLIPILTKALQEAMARIETLEAKVKALEEA